MGKVELATRRDGSFERLYAIKHLHAHLREDRELNAMFLDEARIAGLLRHPNVVSVVDIGEDEEGPFLVMDYVEGVPLTHLVRRAADASTPMSLEVALRLGIDIVRGLAAAHDLRGSDGTPLHVVHRDVSPHNVLVGFDGVARVTDFGIAKVLGRQSAQTSTGILKGKLGYMSPEQLRFRSPDRRSDLFSFGVVLYEMLSARRLYRGDAESVALRILEEPPPDLADVRDDAPPSLVGLLFGLLAKEPEQRPSDGHAVEGTLEAVLAELGLPATTHALREHMCTAFAAERAQRERELQQALTRTELTPTPHSAASVRLAAGKAIEGAPDAQGSHEAPTRAPSSRGRRPKGRIAVGIVTLLAALALGTGALVWLGTRPPSTDTLAGALHGTVDDDSETLGGETLGGETHDGPPSGPTTDTLTAPVAIPITDALPITSVTPPTPPEAEAAGTVAGREAAPPDAVRDATGVLRTTGSAVTGQPMPSVPASRRVGHDTPRETREAADAPPRPRSRPGSREGLRTWDWED